jgi:predicted nucleic acid-binding protein
MNYMSDRVFVDTNIFVYAYTGNDVENMILQKKHLQDKNIEASIHGDSND